MSGADAVTRALAMGHRDWDAQYRAGRWDYLAEEAEAHRFAALAAHVLARAPGDVLDLGCGGGLLYRALGGAAFPGRYLGLDWSLTSLPRSATPRHRFLCADLTTLPLRSLFDVVVFGEVLYYVSRPLEVVAAAERLLAPGGALLLSLYRPRPDPAGPWPKAVDRLVAGLLDSGAGHLQTVVDPVRRRRWSLYIRPKEGEAAR